MKLADFEQKQYELSIMAQMNQLYNQSRAHYWTRRNRAVQIGVASFAVLGLCLSFASIMADSRVVDVFAIIVGVGAAIFAIALNVLPLGDWAAEHSSLLRQWSDLREDIEALEMDIGESNDPVDAHLLSRLKTLDGKVHRICGGEIELIESLRDKCYADAVRSRHPEPAASCGAPAELRPSDQVANPEKISPPPLLESGP
jgi:hypothetical protein